MTTLKTEDNHGLLQAIAQMAGVADMVKALDVDYDRLEELRDEKIELEEELASAPDHEMMLIAEAKDNLDAWKIENQDELAELEDAASGVVHTGKQGKPSRIYTKL